MSLLSSKRNDLGVAPKLTLDWNTDKAEDSLNALFGQVIQLSDEAISWYINAKRSKRRGAQFIRVTTILLGALAAVLPIVGEMYPKGNGTFSIRAGWTTVMLGIAGAFLLLDRYFGYSSAWMRYIIAELQLRQISQEFQVDWEAERASWQGAVPSKEQVGQMLARSKTYISQVNTIVREETSTWVREFQDAIKYLDESIKVKSAITEPGALNLTIENGEEATDGWNLIINDGRPEVYKGKSAGKRNMLPGRHEIKVIARVKERTVQAEKVVTVPAGGTCNETLTLV